MKKIDYKYWAEMTFYIVGIVLALVVIFKK